MSRSLHRRCRGIDVVLRVDELPVELVAGVGGQLGEEGALGAPVAVAKRMQRVDIAEVVGEPVDEGLAIEPAESILVGELAEDLRPVRLDVLGQTEEVGLRQNHRPQLAGPLVEPGEEVAVEPPR